MADFARQVDAAPFGVMQFCVTTRLYFTMVSPTVDILGGHVNSVRPESSSPDCLWSGPDVLSLLGRR